MRYLVIKTKEKDNIVEHYIPEQNIKRFFVHTNGNKTTINVATIGQKWSDNYSYDNAIYWKIKNA